MSEPSSDTWEIFDDRLPFAGTLYSKGTARMVVIGLGGGELLVVSPAARLGEARWAQLERWGRPRFLLAPNHYHSLGLTAWKERYPEVTIVAHSTALPRLRKRLPGLTFSELDVLQAALPPEVRVFSPPQAKQGETWVSVKTGEGVAWFVTDGILNLERLAGGPMGLLLRLAGFRARLMVNPLLKRLFLRDKAGFKTWVTRELERDRPVLFVPAHGAPLRGPGVSDQLLAAVAAA